MNKNTNSIPVQRNVPFAPTKRAIARRRSWKEVIESLKDPRNSVVLSKEARPSIQTAASNAGLKVRAQQIDKYHIRVSKAEEKEPVAA